MTQTGSQIILNDLSLNLFKIGWKKALQMHCSNSVETFQKILNDKLILLEHLCVWTWVESTIIHFDTQVILEVWVLRKHLLAEMVWYFWPC